VEGLGTTVDDDTVVPGPLSPLTKPVDIALEHPHRKIASAQRKCGFSTYPHTYYYNYLLISRLKVGESWAREISM